MTSSEPTTSPKRLRILDDAEIAALYDRPRFTAGADVIRRVSPVAWQHINFYGRYEFTKAPAMINVDGIIAELAQRLIVPSEDDG